MLNPKEVSLMVGSVFGPIRKRPMSLAGTGSFQAPWLSPPHLYPPGVTAHHYLLPMSPPACLDSQGCGSLFYKQGSGCVGKEVGWAMTKSDYDSWGKPFSPKFNPFVCKRTLHSKSLPGSDGVGSLASEV